ncbi:probable carboxylesterase 18 [Vigna radiata var. radiata]|uniref:Probable carboxylesterase 18 n=1 Tax=Vigna radiata var. radiata TaxID=3916 RepID=A0A1S3V026_VIGRR|nr:probable carboxylesterase 18 [Vigna radiata var. radiata]
MDAPTKPTIPWNLRVTTSLLSLLLKASSRSNGTVNRRLFNLFDSQLPPNPNPIDGVTTSDVTVDATRNLWFRLFSPTTSTSAATLPVVVFFHGGGFTFLSPAMTKYDAFCRSLFRSINAVIKPAGNQRVQVSLLPPPPRLLLPPPPNEEGSGVERSSSPTSVLVE